MRACTGLARDESQGPLEKLPNTMQIGGLSCLFEPPTLSYMLHYFQPNASTPQP